jgi:DNA-binding beta-propeller fold protein YncE
MIIDRIPRKLDISAPSHIRDAIAALGRTEDIKFSPNNRRVAVARFNDDRVCIFDIFIDPPQHGGRIEIRGFVEISSPELKGPHGLEFLQEEHIVVANRYGRTCIFAIPVGTSHRCELDPVAAIDPGDSGPGAIAISQSAEGHEVWICNNFSNDVTRLVRTESGRPGDSPSVVIKKWLDIPDGIAVSEDSRWIAVSNHNTHSVLVFENGPTLSGKTNPIGLLEDVSYPHGLSFTADSRFILVADAGSPHVVVYENRSLAWNGVHKPALSIRVLTDEEFRRHRPNRQEGGPKGIDIDSTMSVLATTCEAQPMAFFDLQAILRQAPDGAHGGSIRQRRGAVRLELHRGRGRAAAVTLARSARNALRDVLRRNG